MSISSRRHYLDPRYNYGVPGIICVFQNNALRDNLFKLGTTRASGWSKVLEFNRDPDNTVPGKFECIFEISTNDCGRAFERIQQSLQEYRYGRNDLAYFDMEFSELKRQIQLICEDVERKTIGRLDSIQLAPADEVIEQSSHDNETHAISELRTSNWLTTKFVSLSALVVFSVVSLGLLLAPMWTDAPAQIERVTSLTSTKNKTIKASPVSSNLSAMKLSLHDSKLSASEKTVLGLSCIASENSKDPDAFNRCVDDQLRDASADKSAVDLAFLTESQKHKVENDCVKNAARAGLVAYRSCLQQAVNKMVVELQKFSLVNSISKS
ncbi:GIY-YIG nuclease family protein [Undibacterium sp. Rencai35W]|uniref:GIY-YIG nuclease family protein n=1 Tax=Undibacterium sp. Rencai35W TaxID=3413046 RepID=UPI003BF092F0